MAAKLKVGDEIWMFDGSRRVYRRDPKTGRAYGKPTYSEHWRKVRITGETSRSYDTDYGKAPKNESAPHKWQFTDEGKNDWCWMEENKCGIMRSLQRCKYPEVWLALADALSWKGLR